MSEVSSVRIRMQGLRLPAVPPPAGAAIPRHITAEAALIVPAPLDLRVTPLVREGQSVAQGAPLLAQDSLPGLTITAPMAGRIARLEVDSARRLRQITLFHETDAGRHALPAGGTLIARLLASGLWHALRRRPFGPLADPARPPAAIVVMGLATAPGAPDPADSLAGREEAFAAGLDALATLTQGPVFVVQPRGAPLPGLSARDRIRPLDRPALHPWGLAGINIHAVCPATPTAPVWDIAAEDVAAIGTLQATGLRPRTRLVGLGGTGLRAPLLLRCQPWADLRGLCQGHLLPGQTTLLSGSALDGRPARWLRGTDRQVTALRTPAPRARDHWFLRALTGAARPRPLIPSPALERALGGDIPAVALLRAIAAGDGETAQRLGLLSLLPEDLALADYVTGAAPRLADQLAALLARIAEEEAP